MAKGAIKILSMDTDYISGTSFHGVTFKTIPLILIFLFGNVKRDSIDEKVQFRWFLETNGVKFFVYDWKEYRDYPLDEEIEWHIGALNIKDSEIAKKSIEEAINAIIPL